MKETDAKKGQSIVFIVLYFWSRNQQHLFALLWRRKYLRTGVWTQSLNQKALGLCARCHLYRKYLFPYSRRWQNVPTGEQAVEVYSYGFEEYYSSIVATSKIAKRMTVKLKKHRFDHFGQISTNGFLRNLKLACESNKLHVGLPLSLSYFAMEMPVSSSLHSRTASNWTVGMKIFSRANTTTLTTYLQDVSSLLRTYTIDENIANAEDGFSTFSQPLSTTPAQHAEELIGRALWYGDVYEKQNLNKMFPVTSTNSSGITCVGIG